MVSDQDGPRLAAPTTGTRPCPRSPRSPRLKAPRMSIRRSRSRAPISRRAPPSRSVAAPQPARGALSNGDHRENPRGEGGATKSSSTTVRAHRAMARSTPMCASPARRLRDHAGRRAHHRRRRSSRSPARAFVKGAKVTIGPKGKASSVDVRSETELTAITHAEVARKLPGDHRRQVGDLDGWPDIHVPRRVPGRPVGSARPPSGSGWRTAAEPHATLHPSRRS